MNLITLSDEDFNEIESLFSQFHQDYTTFSRIGPKVLRNLPRITFMVS
jgi:hypothetical protein